MIKINLTMKLKSSSCDCKIFTKTLILSDPSDLIALLQCRKKHKYVTALVYVSYGPYCSKQMPTFKGHKCNYSSFVTNKIDN